jgi:phage gp46-like protein
MPIVIDDRLVTLNGAKVVAGEMLRTTTVAGRVVRLLLMWRGHWPAAAGRVIGNAAWERMQRATGDAQTIRLVIQDFHDALDPLVQEGVINSVAVSTELTRKGRLFYVSWRSRRGEPNDVVLTDPESLNG